MDIAFPIMTMLFGVGLAAVITFLFGFYTIGPTERGVMTTFGKATRIGGTTAQDPVLGALLENDNERARYNFPMIRVIQPGGPYFKWPWQKVIKIDMTIRNTSITWDPDVKQSAIIAVTKDNLSVGITGQIRWKPCERNLYAFAFGIDNPASHVIGYFISILRDRIATFQRELGENEVEGVSINDLRKNLPMINQYMEEACRKTSARYGVDFDQSLVTSIDAPPDVDEALASINTTQNQVAALISQAHADADQTTKMAEQAVEIATNKAMAEASPLIELNKTLLQMHREGGPRALTSYLRNASLPLRERASQTVINMKE
jgi:regulator of protease activity HflC (stomatin/prohibitin superfamily)